LKRARVPVWSEKKADLVACYLKLFVRITGHGTYIDGFAGPQQPGQPQIWTANRVFETQSPDPKRRRIQSFHLFELDSEGITALNELVARCGAGRKVSVIAGNFNEKVDALLASRVIREKEATFALLDQRTFECEWTTLRKLAAYKERKIELFYFLANGWLDRALVATKDEATLERWWGNGTWRELRTMKPMERAEWLARRFRDELGYAHVIPWPICESATNHHVMYFMIHATDHKDASELMSRAYCEAIWSKWEQLAFMPIARSVEKVNTGPTPRKAKRPQPRGAKANRP
jgi:three-Cys-motif partner protein